MLYLFMVPVWGDWELPFILSHFLSDLIFFNINSSLKQKITIFWSICDNTVSVPWSLLTPIFCGSLHLKCQIKRTKKISCGKHNTVFLRALTPLSQTLDFSKFYISMDNLRTTTTWNEYQSKIPFFHYDFFLSNFGSYMQTLENVKTSKC